MTEILARPNYTDKQKATIDSWNMPLPDISTRMSYEMRVEDKERFLHEQVNDLLFCLVEHMANTPTGYPVDKLTLTKEGEKRYEKTSPTNIGMYLCSLVALRDLGKLSSERYDALARAVVNSLESAETYDGLLYNWYSV